MRRVHSSTLTIALAVLLVFTAADGFFLGQTCTVTGTISLYGHVAEKGLPVEAFIDGAKVAETRTGDDGHFRLTISEYDPAHPELKGYTSPDDIIQVKLSGKDAKPTFSPDKPSIELQLDVQQSLDVKLSTWGKIKALFK